MSLNRLASSELDAFLFLVTRNALIKLSKYTRLMKLQFFHTPPPPSFFFFRTDTYVLNDVLIIIRLFRMMQSNLIRFFRIRVRLIRVMISLNLLTVNIKRIWCALCLNDLELQFIHSPFFLKMELICFKRSNYSKIISNVAIEFGSVLFLN